MNHIPLESNIVWDPEAFVLYYIGHLLKPNNDKVKQENLEKCALELTDMTKNFSKIKFNHIKEVSMIYL